MLGTIALYGAGVAVGAFVAYTVFELRRPDTRLAAELDMTNAAFVRGANDVLDEDTWDDVVEQANDYCEEWETPLRFNSPGQDGDRR